MLKKAWIQTPFGWLEVRGSELGLSAVSWKDEKTGESDELPKDHPVADAIRQLEEYFAGERRYFELKLDLGGASDFYKQVWAELQRIPYGTTLAYSDIAEALNQPKAVRAVGLANRNNPFAIVVPCHRVIGKAGELRGYFYGLDTKMALLRHENPVRFAEQGSLF
jgi:methylated-DNA-[protein]-cysteine S-methyltransferase